MTYPSSLPPSTLPPTPEAPTADRPQVDPRRSLFALGFAVAAVVVTLGAIVLAAVAPSLNSTAAPTVPSGWQSVYNADLRPGDPAWSTPEGCDMESEGLHASGTSSVGILCPFAPSRQTQLLGNGFLLTVNLAPGADVQSLEEALIVLGSGGEVFIDQNGSGKICSPVCNQDGSGTTRISAFAWHGEAANSITLRWLGPGNPLELYTNGQQLATVSGFRIAGDNQILELGTPKQDEAIYTHMTLYNAG